LAFRKAQVASWLTKHSRAVEFNASQALTHGERGALLLDIEEYLQCIPLVEQAMGAGVKVVIFGKTSLLPATGDMSDKLTQALEAGKNLVGQLTGTGGGAATSNPSLFPQAITYRSEPLTENEKRLFLQYQIDISLETKQKPSEENQKTLIETYMYLWNRLHKDTNGIAQEIKTDTPIIQAEKSPLTTDGIVEFFSGILTSQTHAHPLEITYLLTPESTPWTYYCWRKVTDALLYVGNLILSPIQWMVKYATGQVVGWFTSFPLWRIFSFFTRGKWG
jgi:hypothetical protein